MKKKTSFMMLLDQFKDFMIIVLIVAAIIAGIAGKPTDAIAIIAIVILNAIIGFIQEYRAEEAMAALKKMAAPVSTVLRDGMPANIKASEIVPGDVVLLEAGQIIPADMRLLETVNLKVEEAALTGESVPVEKRTDRLHDAHLPIGDRKNMAYQGTIVTYGRGSGAVVATGMETEIGKIATLLQEEKDLKTPLQQRLAAFGKRLAIAILVICAIVFAAGLMRGEPVTLMLLTAISLAVAAIPEALPAVITIALAIGAKNMVRQNALIRKLPAMALSNDAQMNAEGDIIGDPTEIALYNIAKDNGFDKQELEKDFPRVAEIPFDSDRKRMTTFHKWADGFISITKGAIEVMLEKSKDILTLDALKPLDKGDISRVNERMAADGLRILGMAMRKWDSMPDDITPENVETGLTVLGLAGMMDPPREEAKRGGCPL